MNIVAPCAKAVFTSSDTYLSNTDAVTWLPRLNEGIERYLEDSEELDEYWMTIGMIIDDCLSRGRRGR